MGFAGGRCGSAAATIPVVGVMALAAVIMSAGNAAAFDVLDVAQQPRPPVMAPPPPPVMAPPPPMAAPPPAGPWSFGRSLNLRIEGGLGYNNGGTDTTISSPGIGSVSTDLLGGGGIAAEAAIWSDSVLFPNISFGAQYLHFEQSGSVTATSAAGPVLGLTSATANLDLNTNAAMFNVEWRPHIQRFHPFLGAGVGVAFTDLSGSALGFSASDSQTNVAGQAFLGFDYDVLPNVYVGVAGRFFITGATYHVNSITTPSGGSIPVTIENNIDVTSRPISLMAHLGMQF